MACSRCHNVPGKCKCKRCPLCWKVDDECDAGALRYVLVSPRPAVAEDFASHINYLSGGRIRPLLHSSGRAEEENFRVVWLHDEQGQVAIFDAANVTIQRRAKLMELVNKHGRKHPDTSIGMVFIESIVTVESIIHREMLWKVRNSNDFRGMPEAEAMKDLEERIKYYEEKYETVREQEGAYIKIFDQRAKVSACNVYGRMAK